MVVEIVARKTYPNRDTWSLTLYKENTTKTLWDTIELALRKQGFLSELSESGNYLASSCKSDSLFSVIQKLKTAGFSPGTVASVALDQTEYNPVSASFMAVWTET